MWKVHDNYMRQLKQLYNKTSKQTQNRLQEIFDTFNFTTENIYNIADNKTKKRINTYIEQWKEQGLLKNNSYFTVLANNIYKRTRVKNSEILELLIYSSYVEEQNKLEEQEQQIMYEDANYYYEQGQQEVNKKKKPSIIQMALFLALVDQPNYSGFNWKQYIEVTIQYNAQQIYKQAILNIQQQKDLEIHSSEFQTIIQRQNNQKLNINNDKISGAVDLQMIGLNNLVKVEGIKEVAEDNSKVRFIAVEDDKTTLMCDSLNNQEFYIKKENTFNRYYGETQKELIIQRIRCNGLVLGLNLPPIQHHFHYCRSTITYLPPVEKQEKTSYNNPEFKKEKLYLSGERHYSKKEIKIIANKMYEVGNKYTDNKSKWSGNIIISNRKTNAKLWNCNIEIESITSPHAILHEQLHAHSISYYNVDTYKKYKRIEEASTELLTKEICKKEKLVNITSAYDDWVENLIKINDKIKIENNTFEFAKTLYKIPVTDRLDFLDDKIQNYLVGKSINEAIELNNLLGELYV